jgi:hypothetical protein
LNGQERIETLEPGRSRALARIVENVHASKTKETLNFYAKNPYKKENYESK